MLSKNNYQERLRKMEPKKDRFSIRKFSVGAASVLIGSVFIGMSNGETVEAQDLNPDGGDNGKPADKENAKATTVPDKVVITTTVDPKTLPKNDSKLDESKSVQTEDQHKDNQVDASDTKIKNNTPITQGEDKSKAESNTNSASQTKDSIQKSASAQKSEKADNNVDSAAKTTAASDAANKAKETAKQQAADTADVASVAAGAKTTLQVNKKSVKDPQAKLPTDIAAKKTVATSDDSLKDYANYMADLEKKLPSMSKEDQTAALNDAKKRFDSLSAAQKAALSNQVLATNPNLDSNYTVDANGVANVSTFGQFSKAFVDKTVKTVNLTADIDFTGLQHHDGAFLGIGASEDADIKNGLWTGGVKGDWNNTGLGAYELGTADGGKDPYKEAPRALTIEGNNHKLEMGKWFISLWDKGDKTKWDLTLKDLTINSDGASHSPFYFCQAAPAVDGAKGGDITYDNVTANVKGAPLFNYGKTGLAATQEPVNVTLKGNNNFNINMNTGDSAITAFNINVADGANINFNVKDPLTPGLMSNYDTFTTSGSGDNAIYLGNANEDGTLDNPASQGNFTMGKDSKLVFNKGIDRTKEGHNLRFLYGQNYHGNVILKQGAELDLTMGSGHSVGIQAGNLQIDKDATLSIDTWENNNAWKTTQQALHPTNDYYHYGPITLGMPCANYFGTVSILSAAASYTVNVDGTLKVIRNIPKGHGTDGVSPLIVYGNMYPNSGSKFYFNVGKGATLDLQDSLSTAYALHAAITTDTKGFQWIDSNTDNVNFAGLITMFGTSSENHIKIDTPKYINFQRTGDQIGSAIRTEGVTNDITVTGTDQSPVTIAQWNKSNSSDNPDDAWQITNMYNQMNGGNYYCNFLPVGEKQGINHDFGYNMASSNSKVTMAPSMGNYTYDNNYYYYTDPKTGEKKQIVPSELKSTGLLTFTNNFNWWSPRRITLYSQGQEQIKLVDSDKYEPGVQGIDTTAGTKLSNINLQDGVKDLENADGSIYQDHSTIIGNNGDIDWNKSRWGFDWSQTPWDASTDVSKLNKVQQEEYKAYQGMADSNVKVDKDGNLVGTDGKAVDQVATITYKDGSADFVFIPITVKDRTLNDDYQPLYKHVTVEQGKTVTIDAPSFKKTTLTAEGKINYSDTTAPTGVTYALGNDAAGFATINKDNGEITLNPTTTDNTGIYSIPVTVTYSDNSSDNTSALVYVSDGKSQVIWGKDNPDGTVTGAVVIKPADAIQAHKTSDDSMSFDDNDAKQAVGEVDVYGASDGGALTSTPYTYDAATGDFVNGTNKLGAHISYETLPNTTAAGDTTTGNVKVSFDMNSEPVKDGFIDNGSSTNIEQTIDLVGASAATPSTQITIPKKDYATGELAGLLSSDKVKDLINHANLDTYGESHADHQVASYEVLNPDDIDTTDNGTKDVTVRINFKDNTHLDVAVKEAIKVADGEDAEYQPNYDIVVSGDQKEIKSAVPTWNEKGKPADGVTYKVTNGNATVSDDGIVTIPATDLTDTGSKDITVKVTYKDGTSDYVHFLAYEVKGVGTVNDPNSAQDAIHNSYDLPNSTKFEWVTAPDPHTTDPQNLKVNVTINDKTVQVPVTVKITKAAPDNTTKVYSDDSSATIVVDTPNYHKTTGDNTPQAPKVKEVTLYDDKGKVVKTFTLSADGKNYTDGNGNQFAADAFTTKWADSHAMNTDSGKFATDGTATTTTTSDDERDSTGNSNYRVVLHWTDDAASEIGIPAPGTTNDTNWANVYANVYGAKAAKASDANNNLKATHNVDSTLKDAENYVDKTDLTKEHNSEVTSVDWKTTPDITKLGEQNGVAEIHFADKTVLDVPVSITVEKSDADKFNDKNTDENPLTHELSYGKGSIVPDTDALKGIKDPDTLNISGAKFNDPVLTDQDHVGKDTDYQATVNFKDGSATTVTIPVMITDQATTDAPTATSEPVQVYEGDTVEPVSIIDQSTKKLPDGTKEAWTTAPDYHKVGTQDVEISLTYPDGTQGSLKGKVTVEKAVTPKTIILHQDTPATDEDAKQGINEALEPNGDKGDGLPASVKWATTAPATDKAGTSKVDLTITYKDGFTHTLKDVPVNVWAIKKGTDEKDDPTDPDYKNMVKNITRTITVDGQQLPVQTVTFTRDKYTDTTNADNVTYGVWTSENPTFKETGKVTKDGYATTVVGKNAKNEDYNYTANGTIAAETIEAPTTANTDWDPKNETITVTNKAKEQTVNISYIDKKSGQAVSVTSAQSFTGNTDDKVTITKAADSKSFKIGDKTFAVPEGYKIDKTGLVATYTIPAKDGKLTVTLDKLTTLDPTNPDDVDPKNPGDNSDMFETITRTITYTDPTTGKPVNDKQEVKYQRTKTINEDDAEDISYGKWTLMDGQTASWPDYEVKVFDGGYDITASGKDTKGNDVAITTKDGKKIIASDTPTVSDDLTKLNNVTITLTYKRNQAGKFIDDNKNNAATQTILVHQTETNDPSKIVATDGIKKSDDYKLADKDPVVWTDPAKLPDTSVVTPKGDIPTYEATVNFSDGSHTKVNIPIKVWNDKSRFEEDNNPDPDHKNVLGQEIPYNKGTVVKKGDSAIKGFDKDQYDITSVVYNEDVDTSKVTDTDVPYDVYIKFGDGTEIKTGVTVPVKILDQGDASHFDHDNGDKNALVHELSYGKGYNNGALAPETAKDGIGKTAADNAKTIADYNIDKVIFNDTVSTETAHEAEGQAATITFKDGTTSVINIPVEITDQASENDKNIVIKTNPVQTDQGKAVEAGSLVDTDKTKVPEGTKYVYGSKTADFTKPGTQDVNIIAHYPDGTIGKEISGKITVEATPEVQTITLKQGIEATADDAKTGIGNLTGEDGYPASVAWTTDAPSTKESGSGHVNVTITYADGYQKSVDVPVNVLKTVHGSKETPKDPDGKEDLYREVTRNVSIDGNAQTPQTVTFTRDAYVDTQDGNKITGYSDWVKNGNFKEVNVHKDGYASIVKLNGKDVSLTNETIPAEDKDITPDSQDENYVVTYSANADVVNIKYVDAKDKKTEVTDDTPGDHFNGTTAQKITIAKDQLTIPTGYKLNDSLNGDYTYTFGSDKNQTKVIYVDKLTTLDPTDPNVDPSKNSNMFKDVTRTIIVKNPETGKDDTPIVQTVHLQRTKTINETTGKVDSYGKWTFKDDTQTWPEFPVPQFDKLYTITATDDKGNAVDISSNKIAAKSFDPSDEKNIPADTTITISYKRTEAGKFKDDNSDNALVQTILVHQTETNEADKIDAKTGIKNPDDYNITDVKFNDLSQIDTTKLGEKSYDATVTFADKTTLKVSIPVKVYNDASKFDEDNAKNPLTQVDKIKQYTPTPAGSSANGGFSQDTITKYNIGSTSFDKDVDTSKLTDSATDYDVTVKFTDGSSTKVKVPVKIVSGDATKFNHDNKPDPTDPNAKDALAQQIRVKQGTDPTTIDAENGIKNIGDYDIKSVNFNDASKIDTSANAAGTEKSYAATVVFNDGTQSSINIPIYVYNDATNYHDDHKDPSAPTKTIATNPVHENLGSQVPATDASKALTDDEISKYGITTTGDDAPKFNTAIDTTKVDKDGTNYGATLHFADGSSLSDVQVKVIVDDKGDAAHFQDNNTDNALVQQLTWGVGTHHETSEAINGIKDPAAYNVTGATFTTLPSTEKKAAVKNYEATVNFQDGTSLKVEIPVEITDQATDTVVDTQPIHVPVDPGKTPTLPDPKDGIKDPDKLPDGTKVEWKKDKDGKDPVVPTPGQEPTKPTITITYPDGTKKDVNPDLDSIWVPVIGKLTTHQNEVPDVTKEATAKEAITNFGQGAGYPETLTWVDTPKVSDPGLTHGTVHVTYSDGYTTDVTVPINVLETKKGTEVTKDPTDPDYDNMVKNITRTITVDNGTPTVQTVTFTRDKYTDTTKTSDNVTYGVWTSEDPTFKETDKLTKDGYTASADGEDAKGNKYELTDNGTIAQETISAPTTANTDWAPKNETITVTNKANDQKVTLNFVSAADGKTIVGHQDLNGTTDQTITIDPTKLTLPDSYKLDKNSGLPDSYTFKSSGNDPITVIVDHLTTIKPTDPDVDPTSHSDMFESITRHFDIQGLSGDQETSAQINDQVVNFQRTKTVNDQDPTDITYGKWTPVNDTNTSWQEAKVTNLDHYNVSATQDGKDLDITSGKIEAVTVQPNGDNPTKDTTIILSYSLDQSGKFQHDMDHDALINIIRVKKGTDPKEVKASDGISKQAEYHVTNVAWDKDVNIDTSTTGEKPYAAVISFSDGSTLDVNIPVKVYDKASDFKDDYDAGKITTIPVVEHVGIPAPATDAIKAFDDETKTKYGIVASDADNTTKFTHTVPVDKVQETKVSAQVVFDDGSVANIAIPVDIQGSDASEFLNNENAKVQTVEEIYNSVVDKHDAFTKGLVDAKRDHVTDANFIDGIDTTQKDKTINYRANLKFEDGSTLDVKIPVKIITDAEKFKDQNKDDALITGLKKKVGDVVNKSDAIQGLKEIDSQNPIIDHADFKDNVTTATAGTTKYDATITFKDGSTLDVKIPVTVGDTDASQFNPATDLQPVEIHKGDKITPSDHDADGALKNAPEGTHAQFDDPTKIDTTNPGTTTHNVTITFPDGSKKENVPVKVHVYTDADKFDEKNIKPVEIVHNTKIDPTDPNNAKDAVNDPDNVVSSVKYVDPTKIDTSTVGKDQNPKVVITFEDGSTKTVKVPVTIVPSDADGFNSSDIKPIQIGEGEELPDPKGQVINPDSKHVTTVVYNKNNDPDVNKTPGKKTVDVDVTFKDGSTKTVKVPVIVSDKGTPTKYEPGKNMVNDDFNKYVTRTIEMINPISNKADYIVQTIHFVREDQDGNAAYTDPVSGKTTSVPWVIMDKDGKLTNKTNGVWKAITADKLDSFDGYKASENGFDEVAVTPDTDSESHIVTYAVDLNNISMFFENLKVNTNQDATFNPILISKKTGRRLNIPFGQLLYSFDPQGMKNLPKNAKVDTNSGKITVPAGQLAKIYNMSLIAKNSLGETAPLVATLDVTNPNQGKGDSGDNNTGNQTKPGDNTNPTTPTTPTAPSDNTQTTPSDNTGSQTTPTTPVTPAPTTKDDSKYDPIGQDITTKPGDLPDPSEGIKNKDQMPAGTDYTWKTSPNVDSEGTANATVVVKFSDGSTKDVNVQIDVKNPDSEKQDSNETSEKPTAHKSKNTKPIIIHLTIKKGGHLPSPEDLVKNMDEMPDGTKVYWIKKPNVHKAGKQEGIIGVKYPNGKTTKKSFYVTVRPGNALSGGEETSTNSPRSEQAGYNNSSRLGSSNNGGYGYNSTTAPQGEFAGLGSLGRSDASAAEANKNNSNSTLPDTGSKDNEAAEAAGLAALGLSMIGLAGVKKRRKHN